MPWSRMHSANSSMASWNSCESAGSSAAALAVGVVGRRSRRLVVEASRRRIRRRRPRRRTPASRPSERSDAATGHRVSRLVSHGPGPCRAPTWQSLRPLWVSQPRDARRRRPRRHSVAVRVLVVDDEVRLAEAVARGLTAEGFDVEVVHDGLDGLWRARERDYGAIVLDLLLPGMNGYEVCRTLRDEGIWTPILMLTAKTASTTRPRRSTRAPTTSSRSRSRSSCSWPACAPSPGGARAPTALLVVGDLVARPGAAVVPPGR